MEERTLPPSSPTGCSIRGRRPRTSRLSCPARVRGPDLTLVQLAGQVFVHESTDVVGFVTVGEDHQFGERSLEGHVAPGDRLPVARSVDPVA